MSLDISTLRQRLQQALGEEFTVGALLGEGGFAAVFRVRERRQHRDVAVKVVDLGLTPSPSLAVRFVREARTVARLEHPHIVDRKSTRLNSSHVSISYAVFCL